METGFAVGLGIGLGVGLRVGPAFAWGVFFGGGGLKGGDLPATLLYGGDAFGMLSFLIFGGGCGFVTGREEVVLEGNILLLMVAVDLAR